MLHMLWLHVVEPIHFLIWGRAYVGRTYSGHAGSNVQGWFRELQESDNAVKQVLATTSTGSPRPVPFLFFLRDLRDQHILEITVYGILGQAAD